VILINAKWYSITCTVSKQLLPDLNREETLDFRIGDLLRDDFSIEQHNLQKEQPTRKTLDVTVAK